MTQKRTAWSGIVLAALLVLTQSVTALADTWPFFQSQNGSTFAGGWFEDPGEFCDTSGGNYQSPDFNNLGTTKTRGGILAFANVGGTRVGAHSNLDAMSLGLIEGSGGMPQNYGFYTGLSGTSDLSLANVDSNGQGAAYWGGLLDGGINRYPHCIPDYYNTKRLPPPNAPQIVGNIINLGAQSGQYQINGNAVLNAGTISPVSSTSGRKLTYFVDGNLRITGNVEYDTSRTAKNVPKLAVVVRGNIYVEPGVTQIDGWYIAQPSSGTTGGEFWSCHDSSFSNPPIDTEIRGSCDQTLTVNGAITAKQVNLTRINGGFDPGSIAPASSAEVFNYTPEMVIGGPFFNQPGPPSGGLQSLISLPPVF